MNVVHRLLFDTFCVIILIITLFRFTLEFWLFVTSHSEQRDKSTYDINTKNNSKIYYHFYWLSIYNDVIQCHGNVLCFLDAITFFSTVVWITNLIAISRRTTVRRYLFVGKTVFFFGYKSWLRFFSKGNLLCKQNSRMKWKRQFFNLQKMVKKRSK